MGITGANFVVAETGTIVTVTNEGNGRLVASLPKVHIAITGIERLVPTLADLAPLLRLLGRSGHRPAADELHASRHRPAPGGRGGRAGGAPRRLPRERPPQPAGHEVRGDARLHPLRRLPQRLPRLPQDGRRGLRARLLGADGRRARPAARRPRATRRRFRTRRRSAAPARRPARSRSRSTSCCSSCAATSSSSTSRRGASAWRSTLWSLAWSSVIGLPDARPSLARLGQRFGAQARARQGVGARDASSPGWREGASGTGE